MFAKSERSLPPRLSLQTYYVTYLWSPSVQLNIFFSFSRCTRWSSPWNPLLSIVGASTIVSLYERLEAGWGFPRELTRESSAAWFNNDGASFVSTLKTRHPARTSRWKLNRLLEVSYERCIAMRRDILNNQMKSRIRLAHSEWCLFCHNRNGILYRQKEFCINDFFYILSFCRSIKI